MGLPMITLTLLADERMGEKCEADNRYSGVCSGIAASVAGAGNPGHRSEKSSEGPVFYRQERLGLRQKPFKIIKFRSMRMNAEENGPQLFERLRHESDAGGTLLRKYRLDELPQFWNVIKGDMSLVGPRPERAYFADRIVKQAPYYRLIHQVRPGITSWGMVKYGYASTVAQMVKKIAV